VSFPTPKASGNPSQSYGLVLRDITRPFVIPGLDPGIQTLNPKLDGRVKPGHDKTTG
jgi:hypothetical protein